MNHIKKQDKEESNAKIEEKIIRNYLGEIEEILSINSKAKDYYRKVKFNKDGHFTCKNKPAVPLFDYLVRIIYYTKIELSTLVISLMYIRRIAKRGIFLSEYNIHRLLFISIIMAFKYNEDSKCEGSYLAIVGGISEKELDKLEHEFSDIIDFNFYVENELYMKYQNLIL